MTASDSSRVALEVSTTNGPAYGGHRAQLGDGHLEVGEHLEQQALDLDVGLVDLVDEQHRRLLAPDRGQQRPGEQELLGEDVVVGLAPTTSSPPAAWMRSSCFL